MRKGVYLFIFVATFGLLFFLTTKFLQLLDYNWVDLWLRDWIGLQILAMLLALSVGTVGLAFLAQIWRAQTMRNRLHPALEQIRKGQTYTSLDDPILDADLQLLGESIQSLQENRQEQENQELVEKAQVITEERQRIARDLHDTVSQELFAASMMVSGLRQSSIDADEMRGQLQGVEGILNTAQNDLRILLLHLRPRELEGRDLVTALKTLLSEVEEKSSISTRLEVSVGNLSSEIENHCYRIVQEFISNTLRHAQAKHIEVYLRQTPGQLQLKMVDDGVGFQKNQTKDFHYGLANMEERVEDMAGRMTLRTAPYQGVAIDIRIPILKGELDENSISG
ncbi:MULTISPECIES: sensor histidine kinase [unclassified Streptococcus]|uniref:sensor histidine kinase n=1 Tax=unclassified Streptococcus TaxID=2608887 RepID=UPI0018AB5A6F|nr:MULTISPECIES: sensor histidine kinase [unclassified Streptococcus]MBF8970059.1 sensor histidine kinase [Streptococcus sp. NLN76]MBG9367759.1 sensor histidine kinase [Streptococcus sp. NLN64]